MTHRHLALPSLVLTLAFGVAACGDDDGPPGDLDGGPDTMNDGHVPMPDGGPPPDDGGPPPLDGGPSCEDTVPIAPADPTLGSFAERFGVPGVGGDLPNVEAIAFATDGTAYLAGEFAQAGYQAARNIAAWDAVRGFRPMGDGLSGRVSALAVASDGSVYASYAPDMGWEATTLARFDGTAWTDVATAVDGPIEDLAAVGTTILAGGWFSQIGGVRAHMLARYDGTTWTGYPGLDPDQGIETISARALDDVCIGGRFETLGTIEARNAACWNGSAWVPRSFPEPFYGVNVLTRDLDGTLIAGGNFVLDPASTTDGGSLARFTGDRWEMIGGGVRVFPDPGSAGNVRGVAVTETGIYVAGSFRAVGQGDESELVTARDVARFDGERWHDIGGLHRDVGFGLDTENVWVAAAAPDGSVFFGGLFTHAGTARAAHVARYDGMYWSSLRTPGERTEGIAGSVHTLATRGTCAVYVGGAFEYAGDVRANNVALFTREGGFEALGSGVFGAVQDLEVTADGRVYAGGDISDTETGTAFRNIAEWDGSAWVGLGSGLDATVWSIDVDTADGPDERDIVYAGGSFARAGDVDAKGLARWDGEAWSAVGAPLRGYPPLFEGDPESEPTVYQVLLDDATGDVIVAGNFRLAGDVVVNNVARFDGTEWHAYGDGLGDLFGSVLALGVYDGRLVAGGRFETSGEAAVNRVAVWTGTAWETIGEGLHGYAPSELLEVGGVLFATGTIATAPEAEGVHLVAWDGSAWSAIGEGLNDMGDGLAWMPEGLYVGGGFSRAGGTPSIGMALFAFDEP